ncbi:protein PXR1-like [Vicia villosa]|uniref:protein PXR1-like n=1 Tax=Vicia villosa TaxID=3911 RepID=UPI00273BC190|nr:protein PXR1-like [Vicia villosa]
MGIIQSIDSTPQANPEVRTRRGPVLADFEVFFRNERPEVIVHYIAMHTKVGSDCDPIWISKQKLLNSKYGVTEVVPEQERRTKRKLDLPSISEEKRQKDKEEETHKKKQKEEREEEKKKQKKKRKEEEKNKGKKSEKKDVEKEKKKEVEKEMENCK